MSPKPEFYEPMETGPPIEKDATRNNWWVDTEISFLFCNCSVKNMLTPNENGFICCNSARNA